MIRCRPGLAPPTSDLANSAWRTNSCATRSPAWRAACLFTGRDRADERGNPTSPQTTSRSRSSSTCCSTTRRSAGILQAMVYARFNDLYHEARKPGPIIEAACWAHGRRKLAVLVGLRGIALGKGKPGSSRDRIEAGSARPPCTR